MPKEVFGANYPFLPRTQVLTDAEIVRLARLFIRAGAAKLRITGGEPLLRDNLPELVQQLAALPGAEDLSVTTNGALLAEHAPSLAGAGLQRINVSLDALSDAVFGRMNGREFRVRPVLDGIDAALAAGLGVKINMVVQRSINDGEILPMARYFRDRGLTLRFIEYMDVGNCNGWRMDEVVPSREIVARIAVEHALEPLEPNYQGEVAARHRYAGTQTEIGLVSSVTEPFCRDCHRARLSADGRLFLCLFATTGTDFKRPLREGWDDAALFDLISRTWGARADRYSEERRRISSPAEKGTAKVEMSYIGG